jgi:metal-sulfur cluster biosynthetic enzyme
MVTQEAIIEKLRECLDPELGINIVDLGLVYSINIDDSNIGVQMTLTTPGCPLDSYFVKDITTKLKTLKGVKDVFVELTFDPPWNPAKMSDETRDILGFVN